MAVYSRTVVSNLYFQQSLIISNGSTLPIYGTLERANNYFGSMLEGQLWEYTESSKRFRALVSATKRIDRLRFDGDMASADQPLQFPRGTDTIVPVDIEHACYELALALLKGIDPDTEQDNLTMTVQAYGTLRSEHDRGITPPYFRAGIPSATAWNYLLPYLSEAGKEIVFRRVS